MTTESTLASKRLELLVVEVLQICRPLHLLDLHFDAQDLTPHLDNHFQVQADGPTRARHSDNDSRPGVGVSVLRLCEKLLRQRLIESQTLEIRVIARELRRQYAVGRLHQV